MAQIDQKTFTEGWIKHLIDSIDEHLDEKIKNLLVLGNETFGMTMGIVSRIERETYTVKHIVGNATPLRDTSGNVTGAVSAAIDITARKGAEEQIRKMAHFDALTNLPNRVLLMDRLEHAIAMSARNQTHTGVIFIDLDHFKSINDTLGHHVGDLLLRQVADRLREDVREVDTVSRLGGDEFLIIVPELRQVDDARHISRKLLQSLSEPYVITGQKLEVTPSIGVSVFPDDGTEPSALIRLADQAMYQAKQEGRNRIKIFNYQT